MSKKIISLALTKESIERIDKASKAMGMNRSELINFMVQRGWQFPDEVEQTIDEISRLQNKLRKEMK